MASTPDTHTLEAYLARSRSAWPDPQVETLTCINAGWESDVYAFDLAHGPAAARQRAPLVLRVYPGAGARDKSAREFNGMRLLHRAGYPAPEVFLLERDASPFGNPFVLMERIDGQMLWPLLFHGPEADRPVSSQ
jgi:aminoglycoside phosphotransferase (APT) family kinase protein